MNVRQNGQMSDGKRHFKTSVRRQTLIRLNKGRKKIWLFLMFLTRPPNSSPVHAFLWRSWNPLAKFPRTWRMRPSSKSPPENGKDFPSALPNSCYLKPFCSISCLHFGLAARIPSTSFQVIQSFFLRSNILWAVFVWNRHVMHILPKPKRKL